MYDLLSSINPTTHVMVFIHAKTFDSEPVEQLSFTQQGFWHIGLYINLGLIYK